MYRPLMKTVAKIVAKIVAGVSENRLKYMQLGDDTLGEVRGVRTIFENNCEIIFILENKRKTIFIFERERSAVRVRLFFIKKYEIS